MVHSPAPSARFYLIDVFAQRPLTGNPLALVPDADDLAEAQMRAIAREFNQSETTFLLHPAMPRATWRLRSFTPIGAEVYGAGHNALGAWLWLADSGRLASGQDEFAQQIGDEPRASTTRTVPSATRCASRRQSCGGWAAG
jgi:trans-2,3-dihydro-3-hydroxyanthranilate isomerase